jgi:hypothetical protein
VNWASACLDIGFDQLPVAFVNSDHFTTGADGHNAFQCLDFHYGFLEFPDDFFNALLQSV